MGDFLIKNKLIGSLFVIATCLSMGCSADDSKVDCGADTARCYSQLRKAAIEGDHEDKAAAFAYVYEHASTLREHADEAAGFLIDSARAGNTESQYNLGYLLQTGTWFEQDYVAALEWLISAGDKGNVRAQLLAGTNYFRAYYLEEDTMKKETYFNESVSWLRRASEGDNLEAKAVLGTMLVCNADSDYSKEGVALLRDAAARGHEVAAERLRESSFGWCDGIKRTLK